MADEGEDMQVAELASLLGIDVLLAREALGRSYGNMALAVETACDLISGRGEDVRAGVERLAPRRGSASSSLAAPQGRLEVRRPSSSSSSSFSAGPGEGPAERNARLGAALSRLSSDIFVAADGPDKKRRRVELAPCAFSIPSNDADALAPNPPLFKQYPLREEQLRSLGWMLSQEKLQGKLRGGLLADRMGFGKTSVAIGLSSLSVAPPKIPSRKDAGCGLIPSSATLIMCPSHLLDQWEEEFWKFLGNNGVEISQVSGCAATGYSEVVLKCKAKELQEEDGLRFGLEVAGDGIQGAAITHIGPATEKRLSKLLQGKVPRAGDRIRRVQCSFADVRSVTLSAVDKLKIFLHSSQGSRPRTSVPRKEILQRALMPTSDVSITFRLHNQERKRTQVIRGEGSLKVLVIRMSSEMNLLQQYDLLQFHVVLASTGIHADQRYANYVTDAANASNQNVKVMAKKVAALPGLVAARSKDKRSFEMLLHRSPALFELTRWRRVILDEFHESEAWEYRVREMLRGLTAVHKWGLSGTPPLENGSAVAEVARLLGFASENKSEDASMMEQALFWSSPYNRAKVESRDWFSLNEAALQAEASEFVTQFIRQNSSSLVEQIGIQEHQELVEHTSEERLIYRQACHDRGIFDLAEGYTQLSLEARAELLKRCAHFDMGEADCAESAVHQLGASKQSWRLRVEAQLHIELARAASFGAWTQELQNSIRDRLASLRPEVKDIVEPLPSLSAAELQGKMIRDVDISGHQSAQETPALELAGRLHVTLSTADGSLRLRPLARLWQPVPESEYYKDEGQRHLVVHAVAVQARHGEADAALRELGICCDTCHRAAKQLHLMAAFRVGILELVGLLDRAQRSVQFYEQQLRQLCSSEALGQECSICLEPMDDLASMAILPCSHVFHMDCVKEALRLTPHCPECRAPLRASQISSVVMELKKPKLQGELELPATPAVPMSEAWKRHGSKLNAVAAKLKELRRRDPNAKALVFVQWADLEVKVCMALQDHGVPFLHLSNLLVSEKQRKRLALQDGQVLRRFQEETGPGAVFALVLSLQRAASGTNLTAASHILFVHPMNAETVETATAYERQALGRVRRIGQLKQNVTVWRFVTKNTVEEHIHKLHKQAAASTPAEPL